MSPTPRTPCPQHPQDVRTALTPQEPVPVVLTLLHPHPRCPQAGPGPTATRPRCPDPGHPRPPRCPQEGPGPTDTPVHVTHRPDRPAAHADSPLRGSGAAGGPVGPDETCGGATVSLQPPLPTPPTRGHDPRSPVPGPGPHPRGPSPAPGPGPDGGGDKAGPPRTDHGGSVRPAGRRAAMTSSGSAARLPAASGSGRGRRERRRKRRRKEEEEGEEESGEGSGREGAGPGLSPSGSPPRHSPPMSTH